jgi:hypothetical protein
MKKLVEIAKGFYLDSSQIKIIIDYSCKNTSFQNLIARCKANDKIRDEELANKKLLEDRNLTYDDFVRYRKRYYTHASKSSDGTYRYIVTKNNELHSTNYTLNELKEKCKLAGVTLIDISEQAVVSLGYIDSITDVSSEYVSSSRKTWNTEVASLQFVSGKNYRVNTIMWLKTCELLKMSKGTQEILKQINSLSDN